MHFIASMISKNSTSASRAVFATITTLFFRVALFQLSFQLLVLSNTHAAEKLASAPFIFDVRINLPLEPDEPTYHDFYINSGPESGFKKGMFLTVVRPIPVHDPVQNKQQGTLNINVARLQVIHVERNITVARLHSEFSDEDRPTLEFESVMIGDRVDLASATMEAPNSKKRNRAPVPKPKASVKLDREEKSEEKKVERFEESAKVEPSKATNPSSGPVQVPVPQPPSQAPPQPTGPTQSTSSEVVIPLLANWD